MNVFQNLVGGLAGALALNLLHETVKRLDPYAPRIDLVGQQGLNKTIGAVGIASLKGDALYAATLVSDVFSNALYYSMVGNGKKKNLFVRGTVCGLAAGMGALELTKPIGLDDEPITRTRRAKILTIGYYLIGGWVSALVIKAMRGKEQ